GIAVAMVRRNSNGPVYPYPAERVAQGWATLAHQRSRKVKRRWKETGQDAKPKWAKNRIGRAVHKNDRLGEAHVLRLPT
ncbi:MAG: hypothetical protein QNJ82_14220, partial [Gammaproteobacteria bacterium]|nr:hypothetical protein [Gammaproteobacteria bacterium]